MAGRVLRVPPELARVDALLDDPVFFAPFAPFFDACTVPELATCGLACAFAGRWCPA